MWYTSSVREVHMSECLDHVEQPAGVDIDARAPQDPAEHQQVDDNSGFGALSITPAMGSVASARSSISAACAAADGDEILSRLQHDPERFVDGVRIERVPIERDKRGDPVDRLGDARHLVQIGTPQLLHHRRDLFRQSRRCLRRAGTHDGELPSRTTDTRSIDTGSAA